MGLAQPEDSIAKQGTDELRLWIDLTDIINDQGMKIATLEHAVQELRQLLPKSDMPKSWLKSEQPESFARHISCQCQSSWIHQGWLALMTLQMPCAVATLTCLIG